MDRFIVALLGAVTLSATGASAADTAVKAPARQSPIEPSFNWTGWYGGVHGGYGWGPGDTSIGWVDPGAAGGVAAAVAAGVIPVGFSTDPDGALGGIQIGYNYQVNANWLLGAETDFSFSGLKGEQTINTAVTPAFLPITNTVWQRLDWFGTIRARLGFAANNWLFYATAGGAYGHVKYSYTQYNLAFGGAATAAVNAIGSDSNTEWGWTAGGGIEYGWARWTLRAEYLYLDLGDHSFSVPQNAAPTAVFTPNFENKYHIVRAALSYRF